VERLIELQCTVDEYSRAISFMGVGVANCMSQRTVDATAAEAAEDQGQ
jgi:hypothetical protein